MFRALSQPLPEILGTIRRATPRSRVVARQTSTSTQGVGFSECQAVRESGISDTFRPTVLSLRSFGTGVASLCAGLMNAVSNTQRSTARDVLLQTLASVRSLGTDEDTDPSFSLLFLVGRQVPSR